MILTDIWWYLFGRKVVSPFKSKNINPTSYDLTLDSPVFLQVYHGEVINQRGVIIGDTITLDDGTRLPNHFARGDCLLASTDEVLRLPPFVRMQGMLKSSLAREGLNHRTALYIDPGFKGPLTLELEFSLPGKLVPGKPILQVEAAFVLTYKTYNGHYQHQHRAQPNLNPNIAFKHVNESRSILRPNRA